MKLTFLSRYDLTAPEVLMVCDAATNISPLLTTIKKSNTAFKSHGIDRDKRKQTTVFSLNV